MNRKLIERKPPSSFCRCMLNKRVNQLEFYKSEKEAETERPNEYKN